jgi:hypothetical protein
MHLVQPAVNPDTTRSLLDPHDIRDDVRVGRDLLARIVAGPSAYAAVRSWRLLSREPGGLGVDGEAAGLDAAGAPVDGHEGADPIP